MISIIKELQIVEELIEKQNAYRRLYAQREQDKERRKHLLWHEDNTVAIECYTELEELWTRKRILFEKL